MRGSTTTAVRETATAYLADLAAMLGSLDLGAVEAVVECLRNARDRGSGVFLAGNGGSAAIAAHWANDLGKATKRSGRAPMRVVCLADTVPWLTALANDEGYERVFAGQLENFARPGDVLAMISASGNSPNLVAAAHLARDRGMETIALVGFDGGTLRDLVTHAVWVPTPVGAYGLVESAHAVIADIVTTCLSQDSAAEPD